jgi:hypothetical protein
MGRQPVRSLYSWVKAHAENGFGVAVEWRRGQELRAQVLVQHPRLVRLRNTIDATSEATERPVMLEGDLVAVDTATKSFKMNVSTRPKPVRGTYVDAIGAEHRVELPRRYRALLTERTQVKYATDEEDQTFVLLELIPI